MLDVGALEILVFMVVIYTMVALALYWIIRLAVRHGIQDSRRISQARGAAGVRETTNRQQATYSDSEPE